MRCALRLQAANPGAVMEDFVRWHSPRDWIEEEIMTPEGRKIEGINRFRPEMVTFFFPTRRDRSTKVTVQKRIVGTDDIYIYKKKKKK